MTVVTERLVDEVERAAARGDAADLAQYLQEQLGQRIAAHLVGLGDSRQIGRWARRQHLPTAGGDYDRRLHEGYKIVRIIVEGYDANTAKAWLFGTNTRLDDHAPIDVIAQATATADFRSVLRVARQFASVDW
jgi:hypothetical protein